MSSHPLLVAALLAVANAPIAASAATTWKSDAPAPASPSPLTCAGSTATVTPALGAAQADLDDTSMGDPYIVRVPISTVGANGCAQVGGTRAQVELILPPGGKLFTAHPDVAAPSCSTGSAAAAACAISARAGEFGGTIIDDARSGTPSPWLLPADGAPLTVQIPVVFDTTINSFGAVQQRCDALGPCLPTKAGGRVQFAVRFLPGTGAAPSNPLLSTVGAIAESEDAGDLPITDSPPASYLLTKFPTRVARATLRRGWVIKTYTQKGDDDEITLKVGRHVIAKGTAHAKRKGRLSITVKATKMGLRHLARRSTTKARLTVTLGTISESGTVALTGA
ncbi:MAG TPA: hypothetical protein VNT55_20145 [Baekduia sp.]|nr:hypothetical protein [Baekduia sp.]